MKKVELLAPAGNYEALKAAIYAGADAIYLGGEKFGARAYADNFTEEQICRGIRFAHLYGRKVYLTVNTLFKEYERKELYDFLLPFYENGLDGVIVQDIGVICNIREWFPDLPVHASTQMTITGSFGTRVVQELGVTRIVPARELSLEEIQQIKGQTGIEIETFIHGAMCYCYSGQCLFSSILGGRSGNRGRCAQPCRLPYRIEGGEECYPLSMKDMCTIHHIPELIQAGIDSFKIEGRMKKAVYVYGVTSIYRKYIDLYYEKKWDGIEKADESLLRSLYIRSEIGEGYYNTRNGRHMITLDSPSYSKTDDAVIRQLEQQYQDRNDFWEAETYLILHKGAKARMKVSCRGYQCEVEGEEVCQARNQPLTRQKIQEQVQKTGNSMFRFGKISLDMDDDIFMTIRAVNELRRNAIGKMEEEIIKGYGLLPIREVAPKKKEKTYPTEYREIQKTELHVSVCSIEQLQTVLKNHEIKRIYLEYYLLKEKNIRKILDEHKERQYYLISPYIIRNHNFSDLEYLEQEMRNGQYQGILLRSLEAYGFWKNRMLPGDMVLDHNIYCWNAESISFWTNRVGEFYLPVEENAHEYQALLKHRLGHMQASLLVYGRLPMMVSANCISRTTGHCVHHAGWTYLSDRYGKIFPVYRNCQSCYNIIYNSVPLSLHDMVGKENRGISSYRLDFTTEQGKETEEICRYFIDLTNKKLRKPDYKDYTTGHWKRGVE